MDVDARVRLVAAGLARVEAMTRTRSSPGQSRRAAPADRQRGVASQPGVSEDREELVADGVHLDPSARGDGVAQHAMERDRVRIAVAASRCSVVEPSTSVKKNVTVPWGVPFTDDECISSSVGLVASGISARTNVPAPAGLSISSVPSSARRGRRARGGPSRPAGSAPPTPSSATTTRSTPFDLADLDPADDACAYLATFVSASATT